ncbi:type I glyceraldehyde-3-phosphate dehydrogenase [Paenibacillus mendelii]|uniref:Glyceraldehyde-3-phosphate dehydrogenase n=1 Tax=Paenibacillus mendelii TaxID=206163 RepID=A0ABV6JFJ3_9BACL|nr:type I glyceraldehyde-3-phosphate dehydrogenase [Paenibacillus mendelii]MCQ6557572.1 type I glyceraldehyde-3-phosphate dehydrogenase [Paenibacillus mendelii]
MRIGVGISGMGRIGRLLVRKIFAEKQQLVDLRAINCSYPVETIAHLLKYDTVHGRWDANITVNDDRLIINGNPIQIVSERDPSIIPWSRHGVELAIDATGKFNHREGAGKHLEAGASRILITAPGKQMDLTVVMGVNDHLFDPNKHKLVSAASCTTNCLSPLLYILDQAFGVQTGWMSTIHSFTSDQNHLDNPHKDLRRARSCTSSIVPTSTGVGKALVDVLPNLAPHIQGISLRVPTQDVSLVDLTVQVSRASSMEQVKAVLQAAAESAKLSPYVGYTNEPLVSSDYIGCPKSAVIDGPSVMVMNNQIKVLAWYDNEWAYASRVVELAQLMLEKAKTPQPA